MAVSKKQQACVNRYQAKHYDLIRFNVAKGGREIIKRASDLHGQSVNSYIIDLLREGLKKDGLELPDRPNDITAETEKDIDAQATDDAE